MTRVIILQDRFDPTSPDYNANLNGLTIMVNNMVAPYRDSSDYNGHSYAVYGFKANRFSKERSFGVASLLTGEGESFQNYPLWFKVGDLSAIVPENVPYRTYLDAQEVEQAHTWNSWMSSEFNPIYDGEFYYIPTSAHTSGDYIPLEELLLVQDLCVSQSELPSG